MTDTGLKEVHYLGFWARFFAFLIDSTAASLALAPLVAHLLGELVLTEYNLSDPAELNLLLIKLTNQLIVDMAFMGVIFVLLWIFFNATPGKMLFRAVIVDARTLKAPAAWQNIFRYLGYFVSLIPFGLGFLWIGFDSKKQGWHDKLAGTVVIRGKPRTDEPD
jgi:uncharacterized RDD family membrane protein YckC